MPRKVLHSSTLLPQGSWVSRYNPFIARFSVDGSSPLTSEEAEGIPAATLWLASVYWASTTILTGGGASCVWNLRVGAGRGRWHCSECYRG